MSSDNPTRDPSVGVHRFSHRLAGLPVDDVLRPNLTPLLTGKLRKWLSNLGNTVIGDVVRRALDRLDIPFDAFSSLADMNLLNTIDQVLILMVDEATEANKKSQYSPGTETIEVCVKSLRTLLDDARSLYTLGTNMDGDLCLTTRVEPNVRDIVEELKSDLGSANSHLGRAWAALNQLHPDAGLAYKEAVKAIEVALGPLIHPTSPAPTLGQIKGALHQNKRWNFSLDRTGPPGKDPAIPEAATSSTVFLVDLLERIAGTEARHGLAGEDRIQSYKQATAAVYGAVAVIGWAASGTLSLEK